MAARAAINKPAPKSHVADVATVALPLRQNTTSHTSVATKKATGNGISMGCMGWPAMLAVLRGLVMKASVRVSRLTCAAGLEFLPRSALAAESVRTMGRRISTSFMRAKWRACRLLDDLVGPAPALVGDGLGEFGSEKENLRRIV